MSRHSKQDDTLDKLRGLLTSMTEGEVNDGLITELERILETNAGAREVYRRHIEMHAALMFNLPPSSESLSEIDSPEQFAKYVQKAGMQLQKPQAVNNTVYARALDSFEMVLREGHTGTLSVESTANSANHSAPRFGSWIPQVRSWRVAGFVAASVLMLIAISIAGRNLYEASFHSTLTASSDGAASTGSPALLNGGVVRVESGTTRLRLPGVGYMVIDGPAELEIEDAMRVRLDEGRIRVRVTEPTGHGFVVVTPHGEVTDLGTEFGVDVTDIAATELVVFEGAVDLQMTGPSLESPSPHRILGGEGVRFGRSGSLNRVMSVSSNLVSSIQPPPYPLRRQKSPVILNISDNIRPMETKQFYGIVHGGLVDDALAYVDRPYEWNSLSPAGMPSFLFGADYVQTFNHYKAKSFDITLELAQPADLYILWDVRTPPADWLRRDFKDTRERIGLDLVTHPYYKRKNVALGKGPGNKVDLPYSVWHRRVVDLEPITLGSLKQKNPLFSMYGIAAMAIDPTVEGLPFEQTKD